MNAKIYNRQSIAPRTRNWQQIEVAGEHPARLGDARIVQVIDHAALAAIADDIAAQARDPYFDGILVDADHLSHDPAQRTEAMAWLMNAEVRDGQLWGELEWTDLGAAAVHGGRYKYFSTEYDAEDLEPAGPNRVRPLRLAGLALTNRPNNRGGRPITNRNENAEMLKSGNAEITNSTPDDPTPNAMKTIAEKLGLPAEATEDEILAAIGGLQDAAAKAGELEADKAAEEILNRHAARIPEGQSAAWKAQLIRNREGTEALILTLPERKVDDKPAEVIPGRPAITNRETAKVPDAERANGTVDPIDEAKAARIRNRATEIEKTQRCGWSRAWDLARAEIG